MGKENDEGANVTSWSVNNLIYIYIMQNIIQKTQVYSRMYSHYPFTEIPKVRLNIFFQSCFLAKSMVPDKVSLSSMFATLLSRCLFFQMLFPNINQPYKSICPVTTS